MKFVKSLVLGLGLVFASFPVQASVVGAVWDSPTSGTLDGVGFTVSGFASPNLGTTNLSGPDLSAAPLSTNQQAAGYLGSSQFTVTFDSAITDLLLYVIAWRGDFRPVASYEFSQDFEVLSGLGDASISSDTIAVDEDVLLVRGILRFAAPVSSFSVSTNVTFFRFHGLTFGLDQPMVPIPLPATGLLLIGGLAALTQLRRLSRRV